MLPIATNSTQSSSVIIEMPHDNDNISSNAPTSPEASGMASPQDVIINIEEKLSGLEESKKNYDQKEANYKTVNSCITNLGLATLVSTSTATNIATNVAAKTLSPATIVGSALAVTGLAVSVANTACEYVNNQRTVNGQPELPMKGDSIGNAAHVLAERCGYQGEAARRIAHGASLGINSLLSVSTAAANQAIPAAFSTVAKGAATVAPLVKGLIECANIVVNYEKEKIGTKQKKFTKAIADTTIQIKIEQKNQEIGVLNTEHQKEMKEQEKEQDAAMRRRILSALTR
ncbi:hypothetical protein [Serratia quinivorans]|uniref:hypothetical protein n=1 Tax=Serratia quinivorans TaxID=137545 RepID=UPI00217863B3|nr:hypothetical protein [Serratia quinivorans]CAI1236876.1 Uncharacterised protein [Serratia quinivorans]